MTEIIEIVIMNAMIWLIGIVVIKQAYTRKTYGKELWNMYTRIAREFGLGVKEEATAGYGLPDIYGKMRGRKIYIHPIVGKGISGVAKTAYAVETKIRTHGKTFIGNAMISSWVLGSYKFKHELPNLDNSRYKVSTQNKKGWAMIEQIFTKELGERLTELISFGDSKFWGMAIDSGLIMVYTKEWETDENVIRKRLIGLVDLIEEMEKNAIRLDHNINNELLQLTGTKSHRSKEDNFISGIVILMGFLIIGIPFFPTSEPVELSGVAMILNIGILVILLGATRIHANKTMRD